ncbi:MAG TPA: effector binding domain-containing protein [candidate division Zixibacteria bacterium]|nr:effector binding domain-containing protein [candidate division Zixibacteria bacterium]
MNEEKRNHIKEILEIYYQDLSEILGAISNDNRIQLMASLIENPKEFSELKELVKLSKTALAHHLERLTEVGLVKSVTRGHYELTKDGYEMLYAIASTFTETKRKREIEARMLSEKMTKAFSKEDDSYENLRVHFERLPPMRIVSFHAISKTPEKDASQKMNKWMEANGILFDGEKHPTFGFNNPNPTRGKDEYGYEFWLKVDDDFESKDDPKVKDISGYQYAVTTCWRLADIGRDWMNLARWVKEHDYDIIRDTHCLERAHFSVATEDELILDLMIPVKK